MYIVTIMGKKLALTDVSDIMSFLFSDKISYCLEEGKTSQKPVYH